MESNQYGVKSVRSLMTYSFLHNDTEWAPGDGQFLNPESHICVPGRFTQKMKIKNDLSVEEQDVSYELGFEEGIKQFVEWDGQFSFCRMSLDLMSFLGLSSIEGVMPQLPKLIHDEPAIGVIKE